MQAIPLFQFLDYFVILVGAGINLKYGFVDIRIKSLVNTLDLLDAVFSQAAQELVLEECFTIPVAEVPRVFVYGSYVKGFGKDMDNCPFVADFWLEK